MANSIMPYVAKFISSNTVKNTKRFIAKALRTIKGQTATLDVFLRLDDPYSYLLIQVMDQFIARFNVKVNFHMVLDIQSEMFPDINMWYQYANQDAALLAKLYKLSFINTNAVHLDRERIESATAQLLQLESHPDFIQLAQEIFKAVWEQEQYFDNRGVGSNVSLKDPKLSQQLQINQGLLKSKGHYLGAMLYFEQEWYWGIDRLDHLESRLIQYGLAINQEESVKFNLTYKDFCTEPVFVDININTTTPLILYWSARSPYSYVGLEQAIKLTQHYNVPLIIKPVLPMMMRGMNVPKPKKMYIFLDTKREAQKLGLAYGFVADPLGAAVERCYALLDYAQSENKLQDYLLSFARAVNTQGIQAKTDEGMKAIIEGCGLNWQTAKLQLTNTKWKAAVYANLKEMYQHGCWGVPSFVYNNEVFWGQDRLGIIEQAIKVN